MSYSHRTHLGPQGPRSLFERLDAKDARHAIAPVGYGRALPVPSTVAVRRDPVTLAMPAATVAAPTPALRATLHAAPRVPQVGNTLVEIRDAPGENRFDVYWRDELIVEDTGTPMSDAGHYLVSHVGEGNTVAFMFAGSRAFTVWRLGRFGGPRHD